MESNSLTPKQWDRVWYGRCARCDDALAWGDMDEDVNAIAHCCDLLYTVRVYGDGLVRVYDDITGWEYE